MMRLAFDMACMKQTPADSEIRVPGRSFRRVLFSTDAGASELLPAKEQRMEATSTYVHAENVSVDLGQSAFPDVFLPACFLVGPAGEVEEIRGEPVEEREQFGVHLLDPRSRTQTPFCPPTDRPAELEVRTHWRPTWEDEVPERREPPEEVVGHLLESKRVRRGDPGDLRRTPVFGS